MPPKAKSIISSREQRKEFDDAVKQVIQQRKAANQLQNAARAKAALEKQLQNNKVPQTKRQQELLQQNLDEQKRALQMLVLQQFRGQSSINLKGSQGAGRVEPSPSQQQIPGSSYHGKRRATMAALTPPSPQMLTLLKDDLSSERSRRSSDGRRADDGRGRQPPAKLVEPPGRKSTLSSRDTRHFRSSTSDVPNMTIEEILNEANRGVAVVEIDGGLKRSSTVGNIRSSKTAQAPAGKNETFSIPSYNPKSKRIESTIPSLDKGGTPREFAEATVSDRTDQSQPPPRRKSIDICTFDVEDLVPTRRCAVDGSAEGGKNAGRQQIEKRTSVEGQFKDEELEPDGARLDSNGNTGDDSCDPSLPRDIKTEAAEAYRSTVIADPQPQDNSDDQTHDSPSPSGGMPVEQNLRPVMDDDKEGDPRSQFVLLKKQLKSQSGATGQTGSTSQSSLFSSQGTIKDDAGERLISVTTVSNSGGAGATSIIDQITSIKEEDSSKREPQHQDSRQASQSSISVVRDELSLNATDEGFTSYKKKRKSRIKRLRQGIRKTIGGSSQSARAASSGSVSDYSDIDGSQISRSSISISTEQQEGVSRLLRRNSSTRSITSAYTTISGMTRGSESSQSQSSRWSRFRLGGRNRSRAQSMRNMENGPTIPNTDGGRRQIFLNQRAMSAVSNISSRSSSSASSANRFLDIYDANDHVNAVRSILSKTNSGRSLKTSLATVEEPSREEEAAATEVVRPDSNPSEESKRDEDYLAKKLANESDAEFVRSESAHSDDSVNSFYRHPSHEHTLVHIRPNQVFPNSPGWQCDECFREFFDLNKWAYVSTASNFVVCEICFAESGHAVGEH